MELLYGIIGFFVVVGLLNLFLDARKELNKKVFYAKGKPYLRLDEALSKDVVERMRGVLREGPFVDAEDEYLLGASLTHRGKKVGKLMFFPEALALLHPVKFMAEFAGMEENRVGVIKADKKLVISGGEYALVFEEVPRIIEAGDSGDYMAGVSSGYLLASDPCPTRL